MQQTSRAVRRSSAIFESLEPRCLLSGYSATEVTWIPEGSIGLEPMEITNSGLFMVNTSNSPSATPTYYISTTTRRRAYQAPSTFLPEVAEANGDLVGGDLGDYLSATDINGKITDLPQPANLNSFLATIAPNAAADAEYIYATANDEGEIVGYIEGNTPGIVSQWYVIPVEYDPATNQSTVLTALGIGNLGDSGGLCVNDSGMIAFDAGYLYNDQEDSVYNQSTGVITSLNAPSEGKVVAINNNNQILGTDFLYDINTASLLTFTSSRTAKNFNPKAINDDGTIVGTADFMEKVRGHHAWEQRAAVFADGKLTDLNTLVASPTGRLITDAVSINNAGQILTDDAVVTGSTPYSADHVVILSPT